MDVTAGDQGDLGDPRPIDELEALLALDALDDAEQIDAELLFGTYDAGLAEVTAALAESTAAPPPAPLRASAIAAALGSRPAGQSVEGVTAADPLDAFAGFVADLRALLAELRDEEFSTAAHPAYGTVKDLVAHLAGVEEIALGWCGARDPIAAPDHIEATRTSVEALAARAPRDVVQRWHDLALEVVDAARAADPARPVLAHDIPTDVDGLLVLRSFELWAHADDIRRATGRPMSVPDPAAMALLSQRLMRVAGLAVSFRGAALPAGTARFVLTGAGGGTYDVELAPPDDAERAATIVVDVADLCRVAARRLPVDDLRWALDGDAAIAELLLAHVDAFARD